MFRDDELFLPIKVYIYLTNHCHYECDYCFLKEMKMLNTKEISKEDLEKIAYYLEKYKVPLVAICGETQFYTQVLLILSNYYQNIRIIQL